MFFRQVEIQDEEWITPMIAATRHLRLPRMQLLLEHGAQVNRKTKAGEIALSLALRNFYPETQDRRHAMVVRMLRAAGAKQ